MAIVKENGVGRMVPIRVTYGGAMTAFDFRELVDERQVICFRVVDRELPKDLRENFEDALNAIAQYARKKKKFASPEQLRDTLHIFRAREAMTDELAAKAEALLKKSPANSKPIRRVPE